MQQLVLLCRPGFESDSAAEIQHLTQSINLFGFVKAKPATGYVVWQGNEPDAAIQVIQRIDFEQLIFCRQWFAVLPLLHGLSVEDRITPIVEAVQSLAYQKTNDGEIATSWRQIQIETPDNDESKSISPFLKSFRKPVTAALNKLTCKLYLPYRGNHDWDLHLCFISATTVYIGISIVHNSSPYLMGIPRLKMPQQAPSRSTLKLEEAWIHFLGNSKQELMGLGGRAVDLGAAPGGWTYQLVKHGFLVDAVDNGPMDTKLMETGAVNHIREDGFLYQPRQAVDWMVCDIVDKPSRVMQLVIRWATQRWARRFIFNLKLPMKKRYQEAAQLIENLEQALIEQNIGFQFSAKQLYHDREEITCYLALQN